jgi:hypothetical protein
MLNPILTAALNALRAEYTVTVGNDDGVTTETVIAPWLLARPAQCSKPDNNEKTGADFLTSLFTDFLYIAQNDVAVSGGDDAYDIRRSLERFEWHETADGAIPVYTHQKWQTFVELGAYDEDVSDLVDHRKVNGEDVANAALYIVADRLLRALSEDLADKCDEAEAELPDEDEDTATAE